MPPPGGGGFTVVRSTGHSFPVRRVSYPARVAGTPPRAGDADVGAVLPQDTPPASAPWGRSSPLSTSTPTGFAPQFGEVLCPRCGRGVAEGRRFCRCGASLVPPAPPPDDEESDRRPWYRRIRDAFGTGRTFRQAMLRANGGMRWTYDAALAARAQFMRATFVLAALGIGVAQLGPWSPDLRTTVRQQLDRVLPHRYQQVAVESVSTEPKTIDPPGFEVRFATDGDPGRVWGARWQPPAAGGQPCQRPAGAPALVVAFRKPADLARVVLRAGLPAGNDRRTSQARPRVVDLLLADGGCRHLELADTADAQTFELKATGVTYLQLRVVDVYPPADQGDGLVSVAELSFETRK
jgi:hypothetical protein